MATSGAMSTDNQYIKYTITVTQNSQNISGNTSNVTVSVRFYRTNTGYTTYGSGTVYCKINGTTYSASVTSDDKITNSGIVLFTKTLNISHNADGKKTLTCSAWINHSRVSSSEQSYSQTLTTIPRKSTLTASNGTLGTAQTLTVSRASSSFTHTITYTCGSASGTVATKSSSTSINFTPPLSLASQNTTGTSVSVKFTITTYSGNTNIGSNTKTISCAIPVSVAPTCKITVTESTSYGVYIKGYSKLKVTVTPTTSYGSAIASYSTTANGSTYSTATFTTGVLTASGTLTIKATVKDKRGRTGTASVTITAYDKSTLTVSNGTLGTAQTLAVNRQTTAFTHTITYKCGTASGTVATKSTNTSISFTPPIDLASQNTTGTSVSITFTITTYKGDANIGSNTKTISCAIPTSVAPACFIAVYDNANLYNQFGVYLKKYSKLGVNVNTATIYGAEIVSYQSTVEGKTYTGQSFAVDTLSQSGTLTITTKVTDQRGRTGTGTASIEVYDYKEPQITALNVRRCVSLTDGTEDIHGEFAQVTFGAKIDTINDTYNNLARYMIEYKKSSESAYTRVDLTEYNGVYSLSNGVYRFAAESGSSYDIRLTAYDRLSSTIKPTVVSTGEVLMHWRADGKGMGIGKMGEVVNGLDVGYVINPEGGFMGQLLPGNTDLNDVKTPNIYKGGAASYNYANLPIIEGMTFVFGFVLEVMEHTHTKGVIQVITRIDKTSPKRYERQFYDNAWSEWIETSLYLGGTVKGALTATNISATSNAEVNNLTITGKLNVQSVTIDLSTGSGSVTVPSGAGNILILGYNPINTYNAMYSNHENVTVWSDQSALKILAKGTANFSGSGAKVNVYYTYV